MGDLTNSEKELLVCLMEECAEVIQAVSKVLRHGLSSKNPDIENCPDNYTHLMYEIGNVRAVLDTIETKENFRFIDTDLVDIGMDKKLENMKKYLHGELLG